MRQFTTIMILIITLNSVFAQVDTKTKNYYYSTNISEADGIKLRAKNPVAMFNYAKFELILENNSDNFIYFEESEFVLTADGKDFNAEKSRKPHICKIGKKISPTVLFKGRTELLAEEFVVKPGGIYSFSKKGSTQEAPDFRLPPSKNSFTTGNFEVLLKKMKKETSVTAVKFTCTYTGDKIAVISPSKASVKTKDGTLWANVRTGDMYDIMMKGDKRSFTLYYEIPDKIYDMQFAVMDIVWGDTFTESELKPVKFESGKIVLDKALTKDKN